MSSTSCPHCGHALRAAAKFCPSCGASLAQTARATNRGAAAPVAPRPPTAVGATAARHIPRLPILGRLAPHLHLHELAAIDRRAIWAAMAIAAVLGAYSSPNGHIETTPLINVFMPAISFVSPALGFLCALAFGALDMIEKMLTDNIYYERSGAPGAADYVGARLGYLVSYLAVVVWGILPGIMARAFRGWARRRVDARNARRSVGAAYAGRPGDGAFVIVTGAIGGMLGGAIANVAALPLEIPAFFLRLNPDFSCFNMAIDNLISVTSIGQSALSGGVLGPLLDGALRRLSTGEAAQPTAPQTQREPEPEPEPERPEWSLVHRPSPDHRWDPESEKWVPIEDLERRRMEREGYVFDGTGTWTKPPAMDDIQVLDHRALEPGSAAATSRRWSELETAEDDYASLPSRLTTAVDTYNLERHRMQALDGLYRDQLDKYRRVDAELDRARQQGHAGLIAFLENKRNILRGNMQRVQQARDGSVRRMSQAGDAMVAHGLGATMQLALRGSTDALAAGRGAALGGRLTTNLAVQYSAGNLPGQSSVFRTSQGASAPTASGSTAAGVPRTTLRPGDRLFSEPFRRVPSAAADVSALDGGRSLPVIRGAGADPSLAASTYGGRRVVVDTTMTSLGRCRHSNPTEIRINPDRIRAVAQHYHAPYGEWETLAKHHESLHLDKGIARTRFLAPTRPGAAPSSTFRLVPGEGAAPDHMTRLELQHVSNNVMTEQSVQFHLRQDFAAGKIPGVSQATFDRWEAFNRDRLAALQSRRAELLQRLGLTYRP